MSQTPFPTFVGGSYTSQSPISDQELLMNWMVELMESPGATAKASLYPTPGVTSFATALSVGCRAMFTDDETGRTFAVMGTSFVEIDIVTFAVTVRGAVATDGNPATISTNGVGGGQLLITSGDNAYCFDLGTNTLTTELTGGATMGAVLYGYGLVFDKATGTVFLSDLFDLTTWDPTNFFQRSINSDPWQAMHVTPYGYIVLPGTQTGETWYIAASFSITQVGDTACWLSTGADGDYKVVRQAGFTPQRISTHAVEFAIAGYGDSLRIDDAIGQCYGEHGHLFYLLTFPTAQATWCWDERLQGRANPWHQRGTWISEDSMFTYWRPVFHTFAGGMHLMGDPETNVISKMNHDAYTDVDDRPIRRVRRSPAVLSAHQRVIVDALEILCETGVGTEASGQGEDPVFMLRVSRDGGHTWGNQRTVKIGKIGEYWRRVIFRQFGLCRSLVFELSCTDPIPARITDAYLKVRGSDEMRAA
jgi:hypothetical protein